MADTITPWEEQEELTSIRMNQMVEEANQIDTSTKNSLEAHKAEIVQQLITFDRDISITGTQTIGGFTGKIKALRVDAVAQNTGAQCTGMYTPTNQHCIVRYGAGDTNRQNDYLLWIGSSDASFAYATASIINNQLVLEWLKLSTPTGNLRCIITAFYHGED